MIKLAFLDTVGLRYTGNTLESRGLGGSEQAIIHLSYHLVKIGIDVTVFCRCEQEGIFNGVKFLDNSKCININEGFDVLICSRSCVPFIPIQYRESVLKETGYDIASTYGLVQKSKFKALWLHDCFCLGDNWVEHLVVDRIIDEIWTLSDWQTSYICNGHIWRGRIFEVLKKYIFQTRNGVCPYIDEVNINVKDKNQFFFNSSVSKGMETLLTCWSRIREKIPNSTLKIIGGFYRGAGKNESADEQEIKYFKLVDKYDGKNGVTFTGIIKPNEVAQIIAESGLMVYPASFHPETFSISVLESLYYNTPVVTTRFGALEETAMGSACYLMNYNIDYQSTKDEDGNMVFNETQINRFVDLVYKAWSDDYLRQQKIYACNQIKNIADWSAVSLQWKEHLYNKLDLYLPIEEQKKVRIINKEVQRIFGRRFLNKEDTTESCLVDGKQRRIVVISPMWNAQEYIGKCIDSVVNQFYDNYHMYIIDDISTDKSFETAIDKIASYSDSMREHFTVILNDNKKQAIGNQTEVIDKYCKDNDIIVLLDGDDYLVNDNDIFNYLNLIYSDSTEVTYGSCHSLCDNIDLIAQPYPSKVHKDKSYRQYKFNWGIPYSHLRTFSKTLFDKIDKSLFKDENREYWGSGGDNALFYPLLENSSPDKIKCIQRILMIYNDKNPNADRFIHGEEQNKNAEKIRGIKGDILTLVNSEKYKDLGKSLLTTYDKVIQRDTEAIAEHKDVLTNRQEVWIDNTDTAWIKPRKKWVFDKLKNIPLTAKILDIGAWTGQLSNDIYNLGYRNITCLDISKECVKLGSKTFPHLTWIQGDIETLKLHDKYDVILMLEIVEHLVEPFKTIDKIKTWLKPNGIILYTIPTQETVHGERKDSAMEHISEITKEDLEKYSNDIEIIKSGNFFNWYSGTIKNEINIKCTEKEILPTIHGRKKVLIGIPTAKYIEVQTFKSIYDLTIPDNIEADFQYFYGYQIDQVRNLMVDWTIRNNFDYILFVDSDIILPNDALIKLLNHNADIVAGVYRQRFPDKYIIEGGIAGRKITKEDLNGNTLLEVLYVGFGCTLINRDALIKIGYPHFQYKSSIDFKDTISEDAYFCNKAHDKGILTFIDPTLHCMHISSINLEI